MASHDGSFDQLNQSPAILSPAVNVSVPISSFPVAWVSVGAHWASATSSAARAFVVVQTPITIPIASAVISGRWPATVAGAPVVFSLC